ncbi:hypothetical protein CCACVL1_03595 [Corchorus capsularis]|uniref:Uncharacterized protein n=1 Tax=Corchorus capsularis TaxID=210143 RepID=A0A1R3JYD1_COCAP|nr:hypothetical protein CCACVL1_03595 [Corchorus capsularis]
MSQVIPTKVRLTRDPITHLGISEFRADHEAVKPNPKES